MRTQPNMSRLAPMLPLLAITAFSHFGARAESVPMAETMGLRLADGSFIRVPCDKANGTARKSCASGSAIESASLTTTPRRAPLKRHTHVFDYQTPGVVASIRG